MAIRVKKENYVNYDNSSDSHCSKKRPSAERVVKRRIPPLPLAPSAVAFSSASGIAQVDGGTRALFDNTQVSKMLRRVFQFFSVSFRDKKFV